MAIKTVIVGRKHQVIEDEIQELQANFGLKKDLTVANDLTNHLYVPRPGRLLEVTITVKEAPVGANAVLDIRVFSGSWLSLFNPLLADKIIIVDGSTTTFAFAGFASGRENLARGDELRIDCLQIGSMVPGKDIQVALRWRLSLPYQES